MTDKHTEGPWAIGIDSNTERHQVIASDGGHICYVEYSPTDANARLISASPDLLAALSDLVAMNNCNYDPAMMQAAFDTARAAIAKARGKS